MRKLSLAAAIFVVAAASFGLSNLKAEVRRSAERYATQFEESAGARLAIGGLGFDLFPFPAVELRRLEIEAPGRDSAGLSVETVRVYPRLIPLLIGRAAVARVRASGAELGVRKNAGGDIEMFPLSLAGLMEAGRRISIDRSRLLVEDRSGSVPASLEIADLGLTLAADAAGTHFELEGAPLGRGSRLRASGRIENGRVEAGFEIDRGRVEAVTVAFPSLAPLALAGRVAVEGTLSGPLASLRSPVWDEEPGDSTPLEPVRISIEAGSELSLYGLRDRASLVAELTLDGRRLVLRSGRLSWAGLEAGLSGWTETQAAGPLSLRLALEGVDVGERLERMGLPGPWRAQAMLDGVLRIDGKRDKPRLSYRAVAGRASVARGTWPEAECGKLEVRGSIKAINADFSASFGMEDLRIGRSFLEQAHVGVVYWRDKLTITSIESLAFGGKMNMSAALYPKEEWRLEGGTVFNDIEPAAFAALFGLDADRLPGGRLDALVHFGRGWTKARLGLHLGTLRGPSPLEVVAGHLTGDVEGGPAATFPGTPEIPSWSFERLAFDTEQDGDSWRLAAVEAETGDGRFTGAGMVDGRGSVLLSGQCVFNAGRAARLVERRAGLAGLLAEDGTLVVGVDITGRPGEFEVRESREFVEALARVDAGLPPPWPGPRPLVSQAGIEMDLPSLEEHFGR